MAKNVLITDTFFAANRHFAKMTNHLFNEVTTWNIYQRPDLRTLRGKNLVVVGSLIEKGDVEKLINGIGETGSLDIYTTCPIQYVCDESLFINVVEHETMKTYHNHKMKFNIYVSHVKSPHEIFNENLIVSDKINLAAYNSQFYPISKAYMSRNNTFSYDSLHKLDFAKYCGGVIVKESDECNCDLKYSVHPDFLDFQAVVSDKSLVKLTYGKSVTYFGKNVEEVPNIEGPHLLSKGKDWFKIIFYEKEK